MCCRSEAGHEITFARLACRAALRPADSPYIIGVARISSVQNAGICPKLWRLGADGRLGIELIRSLRLPFAPKSRDLSPPFFGRAGSRAAKERRLMPDLIYRLPAVLARTGLSRSGLYEAMARNEFPQSIRLGPRAVGWSEAEITDWLESRKAMREAA